MVTIEQMINERYGHPVTIGNIRYAPKFESGPNEGDARFAGYTLIDVTTRRSHTYPAGFPADLALAHFKGNIPTSQPPEPESPATIEIPEDKYPYAGYPKWAEGYIKNIVKVLSGQLQDTLPNLHNQLKSFKPFEWWNNLQKARDWYSGAAQGTRNQLLRNLQEQVRQGMSSISNTLNARGLIPMSPAAQRAVWSSALGEYAKQMADVDKWAAQNAAALTEAMGKQWTTDYNTIIAAIHDAITSYANLLNAIRISENPLEPYKLMLSAWG